MRGRDAKYKVVCRSKTSWYEDGQAEALAYGGEYDSLTDALVELGARMIDDPEATSNGRWVVESDDPEDYDAQGMLITDHADVTAEMVAEYLVDHLGYTEAEAERSLK